jgi:hypothetical protein
MTGCIIDIPLLSELSQSVDNFSIHWLSEVNVITNYRVKDLFVLVSLKLKLFSKDSHQLLSHFHQLFYCQLRSNVDHSRECLTHVGWCPKLGDVIQPSSDLVAHGMRDIVARNNTLIINQSFSPDLGIHLIV